jgi:hypothetical protein
MKARSIPTETPSSNTSTVELPKVRGQGMPSSRTSRPGLQATDLPATHQAYSGRRQNHPCRRHHECKLGDQTRDDADKEPREELYCGRSQTSLYNGRRPHSSLDDRTPDQAYFNLAATPPLGSLTSAEAPLIDAEILFRQTGLAHFYARNLPLSKEMARNLQSFGSG